MKDRARSTPEFPDLAFPEQINLHVARPGWRSEFFDYLYLGFADSTAFSPDVMPLAPRAKLAMAVQAITSLVILGLVVATGGQHPQVGRTIPLPSPAIPGEVSAPSRAVPPR